MKKFKTQKGITLVALIITIVVLLILAAVAIGTVRDSDIIGYAQNAAGSYNQAKANEVSKLQSAEDLLDTLTKGDLSERLRIALDKMCFSNDYGDLELILKEYNKTSKELESVMYLANADSVENNNVNPIYIIMGLDSNVYEYCIDEENKKITVLDKKNTDYEVVQQFKTDVLAVRKTFIGKNIEDFEQEKIGERDWKIKGLDNLLGKTEITVVYDESFEQDGEEFYAELHFKYSENWELTLILENDSVSNDKLHGKIIGVGMDDI